MPKPARGQRWLSESEPELGIGLCTEAGFGRVSLQFPATGVTREYAVDSAPIKRVEFRPGDRITAQNGASLVIERAAPGPDGIIVYEGEGLIVPETELAGTMTFSKPEERLMMGQVDESRAFDLRHEALRRRHQIRRSPVRGFVGGRIDLIPHQLFVAQSVTSQPLPRVLLADEVGLGKTIEACLILHRLYRSGRAGRILILVPEPLVHQWFVELLRRFNLLFAIFDEERCGAIEAHSPDANPFLDDQLILCAVGLLAGDSRRSQQAAAAGWDLVVVDEAHHLKWAPDEVSPEYAAVAAVAAEASGLILLTATPEQLGREGHFARLRLLDPERFESFEKFREERARYGEVAKVARKLATPSRLTRAEIKALTSWTGRAPSNLDAGERQELLNELLDRHGTGRVMFRNTRAALHGFPKRKVHLEPLPFESLLPPDEAESFRTRVEWLVALLQKMRSAKILLICRTRELVLKIEAALRARLNARVGLFHEGLSLLQRDRNAAWFAEEDGAQLLLCSEIGSEGRNFQFAHHLVLFDLPLEPELLEQRIGRLDRIGQSETIRIHVPYPERSGLEVLARWYHEGLNAFEHPAEGATRVAEKFGPRLGALVERFSQPALIELIAETQTYYARLRKELEAGQDRLLQMSSCRLPEAQRVVDAVRAQDAETTLEPFLFELFDHYGIHVEELSPRTFFALPGNLTTEVMPELPEEGLSFTSDRQKALSREDIAFLSLDHPIVTGAIDLLLGSETGNSAFAVWVAPGDSELLLESIHVLEAVAPPQLHVDRFLAATPIRVVVDAKGVERTETLRLVPADLRAGPVLRLLDNPRMKQQVIPLMLERTRAIAETKAGVLIQSAGTEMRTMLDHEIRRLSELRKVNQHIRLEEIASLERQRQELAELIAAARVRLEAIRLIWKTPIDPAA